MRSFAPLPLEFYARSAIHVAIDLLGAYLVHEALGRRRVGRIVETEAYDGPDDRASHASRGRTARTAIMFGPPGRAYVYLVYGMYHCFNVVTGESDYPAAVLIRALEPIEGIDTSTSGPGRLCRALGIDRQLNGLDLTQGALCLTAGPRPEPPIVAGPRVGVNYAGAWALKPRRFFVERSPWVSARRRPRAPAGATPGRARA